MEWIDRFNEAIYYIEKNLKGEISYEKAAQIACCSTFHFQRIFSYIAEIPLSEYIRKRRMTLAAFDLQSTDEKIIDLALKYGYESPTSFNRAFQSVHGIAPTAARVEGTVLKAYPRISFKISITGNAEMNFKIEKKEAFRIVGAKKHFSANVEESFMQVPLFWQEIGQRGRIPQILVLANNKPYGLLGVTTGVSGNDFTEDMNKEFEFDYYIAVATDKEKIEGMEEYIVPACEWAIFECIGAMPSAIQEVQKRIITEWLPTSGYEYANAPDIEVYFEGDQQSPNYKCEAWLPIKKK